MRGIAIKRHTRFPRWPRPLLLCALLATVLPFSLYGCRAKTEKVCDHHYYLSGYTAATSSSNGYQEFTCSECGSTYRETIPMDHTAGASSQTSKPDLTRKRSVNLFDLPVYSNKNAIDGVLNKFFLLRF